MIKIYCTYTWRLYYFPSRKEAVRYRDGKVSSRLFGDEREYLAYVRRYLAAGKRHE